MHVEPKMPAIAAVDLDVEDREGQAVMGEVIGVGVPQVG
jgi:hypothetical protein